MKKIQKKNPIENQNLGFGKNKEDTIFLRDERRRQSKHPQYTVHRSKKSENREIDTILRLYLGLREKGEIKNKKLKQNNT